MTPKLKTFKQCGLLVDGHSVKRSDGSTVCIADTPECALQIAAAFEACYTIAPSLNAVGYGGHSRTANATADRHLKLLVAAGAHV